MGTEQIIVAGGRVVVRDVGPPGPPGKQGPQGIPGNSAIDLFRKGATAVAPVEEILSGDSYGVVTLGSSNHAQYIAEVSGWDRILVRVDSEADASTAQGFIVILLNVDLTSQFYIDMGGSPVEWADLWSSYNGNSSVTLFMSCLPGVIIGSPSDIWLPKSQPTIIARNGYLYGVASAEAGDGVTDPDASFSLYKAGSTAASANIDVDGYSYLRLDVKGDRTWRPMRLSFVNATALEKIRVWVADAFAFEFDVDADSLRVGDEVHAILSAIADGVGVYAVLDPIGPWPVPAVTTMVVPTEANHADDMGGVSASDFHVPYDNLHYHMTGTASSFVGTVYFDNPGANKVAQFRLTSDFASLVDPFDVPAYVEASSDDLAPVGKFDVVVVGQGTAGVGDPASVMIAEVI